MEYEIEDAVNAGAGIISEGFDFQRLLDYLPDHNPSRENFRYWVDQANDIFLKQAEEW